MSDIGKKFKSRYQSELIGKGQVGICEDEQEMPTVGRFVLVNFGYVTMWCFRRELDEVEE